MAPEVGQILSLVQQYGLALVGLVIASIALLWLFRKYDTNWADRLKSNDATWQKQVDYVEARRSEERAAKLEAESRLASNADTLREATSAFNAAQQFMEKLVEHSDTRQPQPTKPERAAR